MLEACLRHDGALAYDVGDLLEPRLALIPPSEIGRVLSKVLPWLEKVVERSHGGNTLDTAMVLGAIESALGFLYLAAVAVAAAKAMACPARYSLWRIST